MSSSITIAKVVLAAALSMAGYEEPNQQVAGLSEENAEAIMVTLLSESSRERLERIMNEARSNGVMRADDLDPDQQTTLKEIAGEAGGAIVMSKPLF